MAARDFFRRLWKRTRALWETAKNERASPRQIAWAVGVGVFSGCTPALGFHGAVAVGLATLLRLNRLFCWFGSRVSNIFILPWIVLAEVQVGSLVRNGHTLPLTKDDILEQGIHHLLLDWCIGTIPIGGALGALFGLLAWVLARRRDRRRGERERRERQAAEDIAR